MTVMGATVTVSQQLVIWIVEQRAYLMPFSYGSISSGYSMWPHQVSYQVMHWSSVVASGREQLLSVSQ